MYLSRLILNPRSRDVRRDLADCQQLHRSVMSGFPNLAAPGDARARLGILYRLETHPRTGMPTLLVQSAIEPNWSQLPAGYLLDTAGVPNPDCKPVGPIYDALDAGMVLTFRLRANPTKRIKPDTSAGRSERLGKRVELRTEADQLAWLRRKGEQCGFEVLSVRTTTEHEAYRWERAAAIFGLKAEKPEPVPDVRAVRGSKVYGRRADGERMTFAAVTFDGLLRIVDADRFRAALVQGIGSAKAYGFGLLSIAPARSA